MPGHGTGVVVGDGFAAVATDAQALAGDGELAGLGLDPALADLVVAVVEGQDAGGDAGGLLAVLVEGRRTGSDPAGGQVFGGDDLLLEAADEAVDVVQPVVLDVERVPAEPGAVGEEHALTRPGAGMSTRAPML